MLKIAVPKNSVFARKSIEILQKAGVDFCENTDDYAAFDSKNFPAEVRAMNFEQIITAVSTGAKDIGIVGEHHFENALDAKIRCVHTFDFKSNFSLFVSKELKYKHLESLTGKKIATAFPNLVGAFFKKRNIRVKTLQYAPPLTLAVEIGAANGICAMADEDSVDLHHQMREVEVIMQTSPIIIANKNLSASKQVILDELIDRIKSVQRAEDKKMVYIAVPLEKKESVLQGLAMSDYKTIVMSVTDCNRVAINLIADEKQLWDIKTHLKLLGAENIYVLPIEKII